MGAGGGGELSSLKRDLPSAPLLDETLHEVNWSIPHILLQVYEYSKCKSDCSFKLPSTDLCCTSGLLIVFTNDLIAINCVMLSSSIYMFMWPYRSQMEHERLAINQLAGFSQMEHERV